MNGTRATLQVDPQQLPEPPHVEVGKFVTTSDEDCHPIRRVQPDEQRRSFGNRPSSLRVRAVEMADLPLVLVEALAEGPLDAALYGHEQCRQGEIVESSGRQRLEIAEVGGRCLTRHQQQLLHSDYLHQRSQVQHADELVPDRGNDDAERLRQYDKPQHVPGLQAERARSLTLILPNGAQTGANDLGDVGTFVEPERQNGASKA
jgi:hypothetical protein